MWTGDVQSGYPTQWALNPSTYQNLPNEQVDWASLAQQWIKMKESFPVEPQVPPAPPPPSIKAEVEAGEAPMDVSKDDTTPTSSASTSQDGWGTWGSWQQWGWGWGGQGAGSGVPPDPYPTPPIAPPPATFDYNHGASVPDNFQPQQQGYWSGGPAPFVRNKSAEWRGDRPPSRRQSGKVEELEPDTTALFDAAKRKQLPAWIREGLEKMEREKQKKLERERQLKEREEELQRRKLEEEEALAAGIQPKSKFDTDSEESERETEAEVLAKPQRRSRFDTSTSSPVLPKPVSNSYSPPPAKRRTREEIMQDVMQQMRYVLTDILMTVTNEEMQKIAEEVLADFRAKAPATQLRQTPALTSLTGKLGLGIYDSDSEDSSSESDHERSTKPENGVDSEEELRERINRKRQEFARIERDIEHQVEQQEERERERERQAEEDEEDKIEEERTNEIGQVEPKLSHPGNRVDEKTEEHKPIVEFKYEQNNSLSFTPERSHKEKESSDDRSEESDRISSSKSDTSSSRSSSGSRHKKSRKSLKKKKDKKSSKRKRKRSGSRGSDRRKSSHRKSSHSHRYERSRDKSRSRSRSRSHSRGHYDDYRRYRRHSSESSHKRRHHSYSQSPDYSRGKKSSHRSRD